MTHAVGECNKEGGCDACRWPRLDLDWPDKIPLFTLPQSHKKKHLEKLCEHFHIEVEASGNARTLPLDLAPCAAFPNQSTAYVTTNSLPPALQTATRTPMTRWQKQAALGQMTLLLSHCKAATL